MQRHKAMLVSDVQLLAARRETAFALYFHTFQELKSRALQGAGPASVQHLWTEHHVEQLKLKKLERVSQRTLQPISLSEKNVLALGFTTSLFPQKLLHAAQSSATGADSIRQPAVSSQCALSCTKWGQHTDSTIPMYTGDYGDGFIKTIDLRRATVEPGEYKSVRR